jgi:hypothetical protein
MRKTIVIGLLVLAFAVIIAFVWLMPAKPRAGPWRLADGSELSLAGVTYGKKHTMRYGDRISDYLYPILPPALRKKFGCKVATITPANSNGVVVWLWEKEAPGMSKTNAMRQYVITTTDGVGNESDFLLMPNASIRAHTGLLEGWELFEFPRRSDKIGIRIYCLTNLQEPVGELRIPNRTTTNYPVWTSNPLPATVKSNDLEISLVRFETGLSKEGTRSVTSAGFKITKNQILSNDWIVWRVSANSGSGERYETFNPYCIYSTSNEQEFLANFEAPLWPEEMAWKLKAEIWRTGDYPAQERWTSKGITIPKEGQNLEINLTTNIYGSEIQMVSISGWKVKTNRFNGELQLISPVLKVRSPLPAAETELKLAEVRDDRGAEVGFQLIGRNFSTGGRGATIRELDEEYELSVLEGTKTLDVTLVYTKIVAVEFIARPTAARSENGNLKRFETKAKP